MIIRDLPDNRLLCINQTSHAHTAAQFCRFWGNDVFARPEPDAETLLGVSQHDNGWFEWEQAPRLRSDGYPMDFLHLTEQTLEKLALWQRGVERAYAQHPYAGLLTGRHAVLLYEEFPDPQLAGPLRPHLDRFVENHHRLAAETRRRFAGDQIWQAALREESIEANTRLLKFGDLASLQVCMAAAGRRAIGGCPQQPGVFVSIEMVFDETQITFAPWPFGMESFEVSVVGRVLMQRIFATEAAYHAALDAAPYHVQRWRVKAGS